ncbi:MAG: GNAT family N-acetyltransferase [Candidatus Hodarchaeota archaeon]
MEIQLREAKKEDIPKMLELYNEFSRQFAGVAYRDYRAFRLMLRREDRSHPTDLINWVAVEGPNHIIGYAHARFYRRSKWGDITEIVVDTRRSFQEIGQKLIEKINEVLAEKKATVVTSYYVQTPKYEKIFAALDFFELKTNDVFMFSILDSRILLMEIESIFLRRLERMKKWEGLVQIECEKNNIFIRRTKENVETVVWTNQPVDLRIVLSRDRLIKLIFGVVDPVESLKSDQVDVETTLGQKERDQLLRSLFPAQQFLIMDYW